MKLTAFAILAALLVASISAQLPPICSNSIEIDFSDYPDGPLDSQALVDKGIEDIFCVTTGTGFCLIEGGKLVVTNDQFEIAITFTQALYTAGFEVTINFPEEPLPNQPVTISTSLNGFPAIDAIVDNGSGGLRSLDPEEFMPINLPASYPGETTTQFLKFDVAAAALLLTAPMEVKSLRYLCTVGGGGSDPHFSRWMRKRRDTFHGECDLVMLSSKRFHQGSGFDLHVRTTIDTYYSYVDSAAVRIGDHILEISSADKIYLDGQEHEMNDSNILEIPNTNGDGYTYTYSNLETNPEKNVFRLFLGSSEIHFRFFKHFLTIDVFGGAADFGDSVGLMGNHTDGSMWGRTGEPFKGDYNQYGFEWQVNAGEGDPQLFMDKDRSPQLPYERCRMPTAAREQRRNLRATNTKLYEQAMAACSSVATKQDVDLCVEDIMTTGELGLAQIW